MRKAIAAALIIISMSAISAKPELWIDASFVADRNMVSEEIGASFPAMAKEVDVIRSLGIDLSLAFFPSDIARVGFVGGYSFLMPIGFSEPGGSNIGYVTYDLDCRQDLSIGLAYYQFFNETIGAFLISSFEWSWYRTSIFFVKICNVVCEFNKKNGNSLGTKNFLFPLYMSNFVLKQ